jgi:hypothetical protein
MKDITNLKEHEFKVLTLIDLNKVIFNDRIMVMVSLETSSELTTIGWESEEPINVFDIHINKEIKPIYFTYKVQLRQ